MIDEMSAANRLAPLAMSVRSSRSSAMARELFVRINERLVFIRKPALKD
jgi:hypothetical protein